MENLQTSSPKHIESTQPATLQKFVSGDSPDSIPVLHKNNLDCTVGGTELSERKTERKSDAPDYDNIESDEEFEDTGLDDNKMNRSSDEESTIPMGEKNDLWNDTTSSNLTAAELDTGIQDMDVSENVSEKGMECSEELSDSQRNANKSAISSIKTDIPLKKDEIPMKEGISTNLDSSVTVDSYKGEAGTSKKGECIDRAFILATKELIKSLEYDQPPDEVAAKAKEAVFKVPFIPSETGEPSQASCSRLCTGVTDEETDIQGDTPEMDGESHIQDTPENSEAIQEESSETDGETPETGAEETSEADAEETPEADAEETPEADAEETPEADAEETPEADAEKTLEIDDESHLKAHETDGEAPETDGEAPEADDEALETNGEVPETDSEALETDGKVPEIDGELEPSEINDEMQMEEETSETNGETLEAVGESQVQKQTPINDSHKLEETPENDEAHEQEENPETGGEAHMLEEVSASAGTEEKEKSDQTEAINDNEIPENVANPGYDNNIGSACVQLKNPSDNSKDEKEEDMRPTSKLVSEGENEGAKYEEIESNEEFEESDGALELTKISENKVTCLQELSEAGAILSNKSNANPETKIVPVDNDKADGKYREKTMTGTEESETEEKTLENNSKERKLEHIDTASVTNLKLEKMDISGSERTTGTEETETKEKLSENFGNEIKLEEDMDVESETNLAPEKVNIPHNEIPTNVEHLDVDRDHKLTEKDNIENSETHNTDKETQKCGNDKSKNVEEDACPSLTMTKSSSGCHSEEEMGITDNCVKPEINAINTGNVEANILQGSAEKVPSVTESDDALSEASDVSNGVQKCKFFVKLQPMKRKRDDIDDGIANGERSTKLCTKAAVKEYFGTTTIVPQLNDKTDDKVDDTTKTRSIFQGYIETIANLTTSTFQTPETLIKICEAFCADPLNDQHAAPKLQSREWVEHPNVTASKITKLQMETKSPLHNRPGPLCSKMPGSKVSKPDVETNSSPARKLLNKPGPLSSKVSAGESSKAKVVITSPRQKKLIRPGPLSTKPDFVKRTTRATRSNLTLEQLNKPGPASKKQICRKLLLPVVAINRIEDQISTLPKRIQITDSKLSNMMKLNNQVTTRTTRKSIEIIDLCNEDTTRQSLKRKFDGNESPVSKKKVRFAYVDIKQGKIDDEKNINSAILKTDKKTGRNYKSRFSNEQCVTANLIEYKSIPRIFISPVCVDRDSRKFHGPIGSLVWAKLDAEMWWPGISVLASHSGVALPKPEQQWVYWYGDHKISEVPKENILPFTTYYQEKWHECNNKIFNLGIYEALKECASRAALTDIMPIVHDSLMKWAKCGFLNSSGDLYDPAVFHSDSVCPIPESVKCYLSKIKLRNKCNPQMKEGLSTKVLKGVRLPGSARDMDEGENATAKVRDGSVDIEAICIACNSSSLEIVQEHPLFKGGVCESCYVELMETLYAYGDDGVNTHCAICGIEGKDLLCDNMECNRVFCNDCVRALAGSAAWNNIVKMERWLCYLCSDYGEKLSGLIKKREDWKFKMLNFLQPKSSVYLPNIEDVTQKKPLRVLSLFDGLGTGLLVLQQLGIEVESYYSCESDKDAVTMTSVHFGESITQMGDIYDLSDKIISELCPLDLVIGGSPRKYLNFDNPETTGLYDHTGSFDPFLEFYRVLKAVEKGNKDHHLFWMYENTASIVMPYKTSIDRFLQCEPVMIDSCFFSPLHQARFYWGNIPGLYKQLPPQKVEDDIALSSVLEEVGSMKRHALVNKVTTLSPKSKSSKKGKKIQFPVTMNEEGDDLWITELEQALGFPKHFTNYGNCSDLRKRQLLSHAWSAQVIRHIFKTLCNYYLCKVKSLDDELQGNQ